MKKETSH